jgi:Undecaprenyl-phosphate glucose phosphotransferase
MLKTHAQFFKSLLVVSDLLIVSLAWILAYVIRFHLSPLRPPILGIPPISTYILFLFPLWVIWGSAASKFNLYRPRRIEHFFNEVSDLAKALTFTLIFQVALIYLFRYLEFSRLSFFYFWLSGIFGLVLTRFIARKTLKTLRRRGYNRRFAIIAGTGKLGQQILEKIESYPEIGIQAFGFLSHAQEEVGKRIKDVPVIGTYEEIERILDENKVDIFFVALPVYEYSHLRPLFNKLQSYPLDVKVLPGAYEFLTLQGGVDELDGLPIVSLQNSPLYAWNAVFKRIFDLIFGTFILVLAFPIIALIALIVKVTSEGPIFYRQERIGMNSHPFHMLKFRTMKVDAEKETGPVWAQENDPRRTWIGTLLRKNSLDELPQLFNVLKGDMSLVGPRPERPNFVEQFRKRIPSYMLRHKIKAGMTGWAQVNGWRGNTSLEKRIEHDLYYIQHWSIGFDLRILLMTLWKGFSSKSAY